MGAYLGVIGFRQEPQLDAINAIDWLVAYRLFKHCSANEWYLEGPSSDSESITMAEPLRVDAAKLDAGAPETQRIIFAINSFLTERNLPKTSFDEDGLRQTLAASRLLKTTALLTYGNDEGADSGFVCDQGDLIQARLLVGVGRVLTFDRGGLSVASLDDGEASTLYRVASEVAAAYFGWPELRRISSDPFKLNPAEYQLLSSRGVTRLPELPGQEIREHLGAIRSSVEADSSKLEQYMDAVDHHVRWALRPGLIRAERRERDIAEAGISACLIPSYSAVYESEPSMRLVNPFLEHMLQYFRALRPKPQYRRDVDFESLRRYLTWRWRIIKWRILILRLLRKGGARRV